MSSTKKPTMLIVIGMAGSGKTTMMMRLNAHVHSKKKKGYVINMDPAVTSLPFKPNIDIRDTVKYKQVMKDYQLGPNGGILTSLNLFTTKFDQVLDIIDKKADTLDYVIIDTPGQIEIFTWSASGSIITEALSNNYPTVILYCVDTARCESPSTFMSNMLYACSIFYKYKLPFILCFNKTDIVSHDFAIEWMEDFESFQSALSEDTSYMASLNQSMALVLDEFYKHLSVVGISSLTGEGMDSLFEKIDEKSQEYSKEILPKLKEKDVKSESKKNVELEKFMTDLKLDEQEYASNK